MAGMLDGTDTEDGWRPGDPEGGAAPRVWSWDELPDYARMMANRDIPGEVDESFISQAPGAARVAVFNDPPVDSGNAIQHVAVGVA
jgi:hypothetical protein